MYILQDDTRSLQYQDKEAVFVGPQTRELIQDVKWRKQHGNHSEKSLLIFWESIRKETTVDMVANLVQSYKAAICC